MGLYGVVVTVLLLFPWLLVGVVFAGAWAERLVGRHGLIGPCRAAHRGTSQ